MQRLFPLLLLIALTSSLSLSAQTHVFCASDSNCTYTGNNTFTGSNIFTGPTTFTSPLITPLCSYTVSALPTNFATGTVCLATDANPTCIVGGGSITPAICRWNGSIWTTLVSGGGGGSGVYLPLTGGVLTGGLTGTSATFSGTVAVGTTVSATHPVFDVTHPTYGALCDGATNDTAAIQAAINAAGAVNGTVLIPGVCIATGLTLPNTANCANIEGEGETVSILRAPSTGTSTAILSHGEYPTMQCHIKNLGFDGNNTAAKCYTLAGSIAWELDHLSCQNTTDPTSEADLGDSTNGTFYQNHAYALLFLGTKISGNAPTQYGLRTFANATDNDFYGTQAENVSQAGVQVWGEHNRFYGLHAGFGLHGSGGVQATATATATVSGPITSVTVTNAGTEYYQAGLPNITVTGCTGAVLTPTMSGNTVASIAVTSGGTCSTTNPTLTIDTPQYNYNAAFAIEDHAENDYISPECDSPTSACFDFWGWGTTVHGGVAIWNRTYPTAGIGVWENGSVTNSIDGLRCNNLASTATPYSFYNSTVPLNSSYVAGVYGCENQNPASAAAQGGKMSQNLEVTAPNATASGNYYGGFRMDVNWWNTSNNTSNRESWRLYPNINPSGSPSYNGLILSLTGATPNGITPSLILGATWLPALANGTSNQSTWPILLQSQYGNGTTTTPDQWGLQNVIGSGTTPTSTFSFTHPFGTSGQLYVQFPSNATMEFGSTQVPTSTLISPRFLSLIYGASIGGGTGTYSLLPALNAAITIESANINFVTAPSGCSTWPVFNLWNNTAGSSLGSVTLSSGVANYTLTIGTSAVAASQVLAMRVSTAGVGCSTAAANATLNVQYN